MFVFLRLFRILILAPAGLLHAHKYCDHLVELETLAALVGVVLSPASNHLFLQIGIFVVDLLLVLDYLKDLGKNIT